MSLLNNLKRYLYGTPGMEYGRENLGQMEGSQGLIGTGGEMGDGLLQQNFNQMNNAKGGLLSNIPEGAILGAALYGQGLKGKDPLAGAFPAFVQSAQAKKLLTPTAKTQKQAYNTKTKKVQFASDAEIQASGGTLVPALPTKNIVQMPGGGLKISESYGAGGTDGNQKNIDTANEIFSTAQAMNNVANNLFKNLKGSKTGFVGETIEFLDSFGYEETKDQTIVWNEIVSDLEGSCPMYRLVCGDVRQLGGEGAILDLQQISVIVWNSICFPLGLRHASSS